MGGCAPGAVAVRADKAQHGQHARGTHRLFFASLAFLASWRFNCVSWRLVPVVILLLLRSSARADIQIAPADTRAKVTVAADKGYQWTEGAYEVWLLEGNFAVRQGDSSVRGDSAVIWIDKQGQFPTSVHAVVAYVEGNVVIEQQGRTTTTGHATATNSGTARQPSQSPPWLGRLYSDHAPEIKAAAVFKEPSAKPPVYRRAVERRFPQGDIQRTQFAESAPNVVPQFPIAPAGTRRVQASERSSVPPSIQYQQNPNNPQEFAAIVTGGIRIRIDGPGLPVPGSVAVGRTVDIEADRVVVWSPSDIQTYFSGGANEDEMVPLELYLEGDIVFREGERVVYAQSMYYNVPQRSGVILNAEALTPLANYAGLVRLRADVLRQVSADQFVAEGASVTTSRLAMPSYEFRSGTLVFRDLQQPVTAAVTGEPIIDPLTGMPRIIHRQEVSSTNNVVYVEGLPVFYWPVLATDLRKPTFYIEELQLKNDDIFGNSVHTRWDTYQVLGITEPPEGTDWTFDVDYLSNRGLAGGTRFSYDRDFLFGSPERTAGLLDAWFVDDGGVDTLGLDRIGLIPTEEFRGRLLGRHRQELPNHWTLTAELGYITDRNFLEQFFEREWDDQKDQDTRIEIKRTVENQSLALELQPRINDFFLETERLPELNHFVIGQSLLMDRLTWYEHTTLGYLRQNPAAPATDLRDPFSLLPYEAPVEGERVATRQALELPLDAGPMKVVPFALGELAHWGDDLTQDDLQRAYGQLGLRTSLPIWSVDPTVENHLFNLHGLAHKVTFEGQFSFTDASEDLAQLPLYDELDDNNIQQFRRRLPFQLYGGPGLVPPEFDERFYGVRRGLQDNVTGPIEIAEDLEVFRFGVRQRWQTKRGPPDNRRIIDWINFDTGLEVFPDEEDNFGENLGLADYDFRWHVGDRLTLLSTGAADFFSQGQKFFTVGGYLNRPPRGQIFLGFRSLEGPITSNVLLASFSYRMSPKWASSFGLTFDLGNDGALGENFTITRIGESFLFSVGVNADQTRDNVGLALSLEPRFLPRSSFSRRTGIQVAPAGAFGVE